MISRLLVANRAEIAGRVFATCRRLGIETVAVHSDADAGLPYVGEADQAVRLPGTAPADTYLRGDLVLAAALATGADAIHPGYGFLSENADFAQAVIDAGLTWVGPAPASIVSMGSKIESKRLMEAAGVPVLTNHTAETATEADLPLLVKASAGGGGRGMRIVRSLAALPGEIEKASAEAVSAFGDGTVFVETYVEQGRHVEVQVLGHRDGVLVLGERDCSIQRRHQKVVEEAPAPRLPATTRAALHAAAAAAAAAIDYRGAGTVEFLYDVAQDSFYFLEMNTRLQVEHPVTELVFGADLVDLQLAVAEDRPLDPHAVGEVYGHAIEVRLYAEDPAADWQPQSGLLTAFDVPGVSAEFDLLNRPGIRLDAGFASGSEVSTHYDAMLAKVVAWAPTREQAARRLADALAKARIHGLVTNRDLLVEILRDPGFLDGEVSTAFLDELAERGHPGRATPAHAGALALLAVAVARTEQRARRRRAQSRIPAGWRNVLAEPQRLSVQGRIGATDVEGVVAWHGPGGGRPAYTFVDPYPGTDESYGPTVATEVVAAELDGPVAVVILSFEGVASRFTVVETLDAADDGGRYDVDGPWGHVALTVPARFVDPADAVAGGSLLAPMPGTVVRVAVEAGQQVAAGDTVLVLEAMKMQHTVAAPTAGTVTEINVRPGAQVASGEVLAVVEGEEQ